ncbi:hypothetical protein LCGC14_1066110 [marine sediment metagenome]|uniref:PABS domain-containing protein n=1 Tax=marine sediment metagenome TaxID=412755 RepID=A0A0F9MPE1_9ZZZZ
MTLKVLFLILIGSLILSGCIDAKAEQVNLEIEKPAIQEIEFTPLETGWLENTKEENQEWKKRLPKDENITLESFYGQISIKNFSGKRTLYISNSVMSQIYTTNPMDVTDGWKYVDCFGNAFAVKPDIKDVLVLGVGGGVFPTKASIKQNIYLDAVDINDKVLFVAQEYFGLQESKDLKLHVEDARVFLNNTAKKYDLIVVDAFKANDGVFTVPFHLVTKEFFELAKEHLNEGGIFTVIFLTGDELATSDFYNSEYKTISSVFENNYLFRCGSQVMFSSDSELDFENYEGELAGKLYSVEVRPDDPILTDDYAPINIFEEIG